MIDFMAQLAKENGLNGEEIAATDMIVLKRNPLLNTSHLEILSDHQDKLLS